MSNPNKQVIVDAVKAPKTAIGSSMIVSGNLVFLAGCIGDKAGQGLIPGDIKARTLQAFSNAADRLSVLGLDLTDIVSVTIYLSHYEQDFTEMNKAYATLFPEGGDNPVRTCVGVAALPAGTDIEFTCVAAKRA